jgi:hypothetical protein
MPPSPDLTAIHARLTALATTRYIVHEHMGRVVISSSLPPQYMRPVVPFVAAAEQDIRTLLMRVAELEAERVVYRRLLQLPEEGR